MYQVGGCLFFLKGYIPTIVGFNTLNMSKLGVNLGLPLQETSSEEIPHGFSTQGRAQAYPMV
jgi:hypothetical protein